MAKALTIVVLLLASSVVFGLFSFQNQSKLDSLEKSKDRGRLIWYADWAKAKGEQEISFPAEFIRYSVPRSLEQAQTYYSVLVAEPLERKSIASQEKIHIWFKFRIIEELSSPVEQCQDCPSLDSAPTDLLPLQKNEFLAIQNGGELEVNGVRVVSEDVKFPAFKIGKQYLLFVSLDGQKTIGSLQMGPWGTFGVNLDGSLEDLVPRR